MRRAPCVAFFCDAFFCIRLTTRVPQNSMNSCGFLVSTENRDRNGSNSHRPTHQHTSRPVGRMAGAGCVDRGRGVQPSIAGAWCIRPSQARGASFHRGRGVHLSIAGPGSIAVADCSCPGQCCSAATVRNEHRGRGVHSCPSRALLRPGMQPRVRAGATPAPASCASPWCRICMG